VHSSIDFVLHYPAVAMAAAALLGAGSALPPSAAGPGEV
jgi:hypothetical protein